MGWSVSWDRKSGRRASFARASEKGVKGERRIAETRRAGGKYRACVSFSDARPPFSMPTTLPRTVRDAWGEEVADEFSSWLDENF